MSIFFIAEIGINHNGDLEITKQLIDVAKESGADAVKFQKRTIDLVYSKEMLDINQYNKQNQCPENDRICDEEAIWLSQNMLLAGKADMDDISMAIQKIHKNAERINKL